MKKLRVYVDTSVIGGCLDDEFAQHSKPLLDRAIAGDIVLVISEVTRAELVNAPPEVRAMLAQYLPRTLRKSLLRPRRSLSRKLILTRA